MQLRTYDELDEAMLPSMAATTLSAFGGFWLTPEAVRLRRKQGSAPDYVGVFAVEHGEVVSHSLAVRLPYTYPGGRVGRVSGVAGVATRADQSGRGLARQTIAEVHRRERESGAEHILLWTNRSWGAHGIYERLGYRDVFAAELATRKVARAPRRKGAVRVRAGRDSDLGALEALHSKATRGRIGFTPRPPRTMRVARQVRALDPATGMLVATEGDRRLGYALVEDARSRLGCSELLAERPEAARALLDRVETLAVGRYATWGLSPLRDLEEELRPREYFFVPSGWFVMMACALRPKGAPKTLELRQALGVGDPRFVVHQGDRF